MKLEKEEAEEGWRGEGREGYTHHRAGWYSRVTFFWLVRLLFTGFSRPLELDDLAKLPNKESTAHQYLAFLHHYNKNKVFYYS
jgi:hypothetical protein